MYEKYKADMDHDEKILLKNVVDAVIFGKNKKRRRWEVEGLDVDENSKRKLRRVEERLIDLQGLNDDDAEALGFG
jgi:hypothetical protein